MCNTNYVTGFLLQRRTVCRTLLLRQIRWLNWAAQPSICCNATRFSVKVELHDKYSQIT